MPAIVRVPSKEYHHIARACDMGAEGIMLPMVGTAGEARQVLDCMKYFPQGKRGVALRVAHDNYRPGSVAEKLARQRAHHAVLPDRDRGRGRERRCHRGGRWRRLPLGRPFRSFGVARHSRRVRQSEIPQGASSGSVAAAKKHKQVAGPAGADNRSGHRALQAGLRFHAAIPGDVWVLRDALAAGDEQACARAARR